MRWIFLILTVVAQCLGQKLQSPCPNLFKYRPLKPNSDTWEGDLTLVTTVELSGIWLRLVFDKAPLEVDTDIGDIAQREATDYLIKRPDKGLRVGQKENVKITVKFDRRNSPPQLIGFRLNARIICPENGVILKPEDRFGLEDDLVSPCPDVFNYEPYNNTDIWFGNIKFRSDRSYTGLTIKVILDGQALQLGNWFGEVTTPDNVEYTIRNPAKRITLNEDVTVRLFIKFKMGPVVPKIKEIRINDKSVCFVPVIRSTIAPKAPAELESYSGVPVALEAFDASMKWESPCPSIFEYKPIGPNDDTWYGELTISTETELSGVWLRFIFDGIPLDVDSDFGEVLQREATEYLIRRPDKGLTIGQVEKVRVNVKFDPGQLPPKIVGIRINARVLCPENGVIIKPAVEQRPVGVSTTTVSLPAPPPPKLESPCPSIFQYEPLNPNDDTWYGGLTITTETELSGVWLRIVFDGVPLEVNSNFGEVVQREATEYLIRRPGEGLKVDDKESVRMWVKYNQSLPIPKLVGIRLNARVICPENGVLIKNVEKQMESLVEQTTEVTPTRVEEMQLESPCPGIFKYIPFAVNGDTWIGQLTIVAKENMAGIFLKVFFDRPPLQVTSTSGEVVVRGTTEYLVRRPQKRLRIGETEMFEISVKFDRNYQPPHLIRVELNSKEICPENVIMVPEKTEDLMEEVFGTSTESANFNSRPESVKQSLINSPTLPELPPDFPIEEIPDDPNIIDQKIVVFPKFYYIIQKYPNYSIIHIKRKKLNLTRY